MSESWLRRSPGVAARRFWLVFWLAAGGLWSVALVVRIADGDDGWDILIAAAWVVICGVWLVRLLHARPVREREGSEPPTP